MPLLQKSAFFESEIFDHVRLDKLNGQHPYPQSLGHITTCYSNQCCVARRVAVACHRLLCSGRLLTMMMIAFITVRSSLVPATCSTFSTAWRSSTPIPWDSTSELKIRFPTLNICLPLSAPNASVLTIPRNPTNIRTNAKVKTSTIKNLKMMTKKATNNIPSMRTKWKPPRNTTKCNA